MNLPDYPRNLADGKTPSVDWHPEGRLFSLVARYARSSLNHPGKVRLLQWCGRILPRRMMRFGATDGRIGVGFCDYVDWTILTKGAYEPLSMASALRSLSTDDAGSFLDVGAHHGTYSIAIGAATRRHVIAIEPSYANFCALAANVRLNPSLKIDLVNSCAAARASLLELSIERPGSQAWTKVVAHEPAKQNIRVSGISLDWLLGQLQVTKVNLLKIDVEGYEVEVFRGLDWNGPWRPEHVLMECDPNETEKLQFLVGRGYAAFTVDGRPVSNAPRFPEGNLFFVDTRRHQPASG